MSEKTACSYERVYGDQPWPCRQSAQWLVEYTTPDDGASMRRRVTVVRCFAHKDARFLPDGASQVTNARIGSEYADSMARPHGGADEEGNGDG